MEALTALSVAGSVVQFVEFGCKLLSKSRKLYKSAHGIPSEVVDVEIITLDVATLLQGMKRKLPEHRPLSNRHYDDDEALDRLCRQCVAIAEELLRRLNQLKIEPPKVDGAKVQPTLRGHHELLGLLPKSALLGSKSKVFRKWSSFRKALEAIWSKEELETLASTLQEYKSEIEFRLLFLFRAGLNDLASQQKQTAHQLAQSTRLILDGFLDVHDSLADQLRIQAQKLVDMENVTKGVKDPQEIEDFLKGRLGPIGSLYSPQADNDNNALRGAADVQVQNELRLLITENGILGSLAFSSLTDRLESLDLPYGHTFEWIFHECNDSQRPWSNFDEWLRQDSSIYWINGKLGSGKSTLMRYIYEHAETKERLREWADGMSLEISGFFFWNSGDDVQKSQQGLLRALLFDLLQRHRDLLPQVMPNAWEIWSARATAIVSGTLTITEMKRAILALFRLLSEKVKLCLFIDGLDEYDGDHLDIVELLQQFTDLPNIKLCLSSRPLLVFEQAFADCPGLRLQDLTFDDISHYVESRLLRHKYMTQLSRQKPQAVSALVKDIVKKAWGVFLWVKLVVRSLLRGLSDHNRISDLQKRVKYLPEDLEALYAHVLKQTDPFYHEQASQIFQIIKVAQKCSPAWVTLLHLSWADDEDETLAEKRPMRSIDSFDLRDRVLDMDARLKSVCAGLLESNDTRHSSIAPDAKIMFLHRTVSDWLSKPTVWNELLSRTSKTGFSPNLCMLRACVLNLKCAEVSTAIPLDMDIISNALQYAKAAEHDLNRAFPKLLDQLDIVASNHWRRANGRFLQVTRTRHPKVKERHRRPLAERAIPESPFYLFDEDDANHGVSVLPHVSRLRQLRRYDSSSDDDGREREAGADVDDSSDSCDDDEDESAGEETKIGRLSRFQQTNALYHWSFGFDIPHIKPAGKVTTFYQLTKDMGLAHYTAQKFDTGFIDDQDVNQHILAQLLQPTTIRSSRAARAPDPEAIERILQGGTDPNLAVFKTTPWEDVLLSAALHFVNGPSEYTKTNGNNSGLTWTDDAERWGAVLEVFLLHGADPNFLTKGHPKLPGHPRLSPALVIETLLPDFMQARAARLKELLGEHVKITSTEIPKYTPDVEQIESAQLANRQSTFRWALSWFGV